MFTLRTQSVFVCVCVCVCVQVRVVDKHVNGGRLYLKKGTVVDVHPEGVCDVAVDDSRDKAVSVRC